MNRDDPVAKRISRNFFLAASVVFIIIYARWFQLTPLVIPDYEDFNSDYRVALFLLVIFIFFAILSRLAAGRKFWHILLSVMTAIFLLLIY